MHPELEKPDPGKIFALTNVGIRIAQINNSINNYSKDIKFFNDRLQSCHEKYSVMELGLEGYQRITQQCSDNNKKIVDDFSNKISALERERNEYDRQKNELMSSCSYCPAAWDSVVKALREKGWPL